MRYFIFLISLFFTITSWSQSKFTVSGTVKDASTGEVLIGATVQLKELKIGMMTNAYGYYALTASAGSYHLVITYLGYEPQDIPVELSQSRVINVDLNVKDKQLKEIVVKEEPDNKNVEKTDMGTIKMNIQTIKRIPAVLGEVDVIKSIQLLPGVSTIGEGATGFNVRGGSVDQNLILIDEAPVFNSSHALGFFSVFNPDAVKDVKLIKGGIPAMYGGRLSSVLDIRMKEGNMKKFTGTGGIGTIFSRLTLEGPIVKDKASFMVAGRRSYADVFFPIFNNETLKKSKLNFYDLNMKINWIVDKKNRLYLSGYIGRDNFNFSGIFGTSWGNQNGTLRWNHLFGPRSFANYSLVFSNYDYDLSFTTSTLGFKWVSNIKTTTLKADHTYFVNSQHTLNYGIQSSYQAFKPGETQPVSGSSFFNSIAMPRRFGLETSGYLSDEYVVNKKFTLNAGLRYNTFFSLGKTIVYQYKDPNNRDVKEITDTLSYGAGDVIAFYHGLEPRLSMKYTVGKNASVKASYNRTRQNIHFITNTAAASPLDIYVPSDNYFKPQVCDQLTAGYFRNFHKNEYEASVELFYKHFDRLIDFKDGAQLIANDHLETELRTGTGQSVGAEFYVRKAEGRLTGWISYTLARTTRMVPGINNNKTYVAPYDKTHVISVTAAYELNKRIVFSGNFNYSTGIAITAPVGKFLYQGMSVTDITERNSLRIPNYNRIDFAMALKSKPHKRYQGEWVFSAYNVYARRNPYSVVFQPEDNNPSRTVAYRFSVFGTIIPSITYNFTF